jgi:hypothetical protein
LSAQIRFGFDFAAGPNNVFLGPPKKIQKGL